MQKITMLAVFVVLLLPALARADIDVGLIDQTAAVMAKWPASQPEVKQVPLEDIALSIATVIAEEGPIWKDDVGGKRSAIMLAALAYFEGARFASYVDSGACNNGTAGKLIHYGDCDHGRAHSLWQVWPRTWQEGDRKEVFDAQRLRDRREAARAALLIARSSFKARGNLSCYTGENADEHPKADAREGFARKYWKE
jgi:hypothetical protein